MDRNFYMEENEVHDTTDALTTGPLVYKTFQTGKADKERLETVLLELKRLCLELELPFFACVVTGADEKEIEKTAEMISPSQLSMKLPDEIITRLISEYSGMNKLKSDALPVIETETTPFAWANPSLTEQ